MTEETDEQIDESGPSEAPLSNVVMIDDSEEDQLISVQPANMDSLVS